jgi:hypothetical protein
LCFGSRKPDWWRIGEEEWGGLMGEVEAEKNFLSDDEM